jgi:hypothetical protein
MCKTTMIERRFDSDNICQGCQNKEIRCGECDFTYKSSTNDKCPHCIKKPKLKMCSECKINKV